MKRLSTLTLLLLPLLGVVPATAQGVAGIFGPETVPYAGKLEQAGQNVSAQRVLRFQFFVAAEGGDPIWTETHGGVVVAQGRFSVNLGAVTAIPAHVWVREQLWLQMGVCADANCAQATTLPRQRMLAVPYARHAANGVPPGTVMPYAGGGGAPDGNGRRAAPPGWVWCDGASYNGAEQPTLFAAIGTTWGSDGEGSFKVPDLRGQFLRGADAENALGTAQGWTTAMPRAPFAVEAAGAHGHEARWQDFTVTSELIWGAGIRPNGWAGLYPRLNHPNGAPGGVGIPPAGRVVTTENGEHTHPLSGGDAETRPKNKAVNYIIKL